MHSAFAYGLGDNHGDSVRDTVRVLALGMKKAKTKDGPVNPEFLARQIEVVRQLSGLQDGGPEHERWCLAFCDGGRAIGAVRYLDGELLGPGERTFQSFDSAIGAMMEVGIGEVQTFVFGYSDMRTDNGRIRKYKGYEYVHNGGRWYIRKQGTEGEPIGTTSEEAAKQVIDALVRDAGVEA